MFFEDCGAGGQIRLKHLSGTSPVLYVSMQPLDSYTSHPSGLAISTSQIKSISSLLAPQLSKPCEPVILTIFPRFSGHLQSTVMARSPSWQFSLCIFKSWQCSWQLEKSHYPLWYWDFQAICFLQRLLYWQIWWKLFQLVWTLWAISFDAFLGMFNCLYLVRRFKLKVSGYICA